MEKYDYLVKTDGACAGNPGFMGIGGVIYCGENRLFSFYESCGRGTNNEAEYLAVIKGLEEVKQFKPSSVLLESDSEVVVSNPIAKARGL